MNCDRCGKEILSDEPAKLISAGGDMEWSICDDCYSMLYDRTHEIDKLRELGDAAADKRNVCEYLEDCQCTSCEAINNWWKYRGIK